MKKDQLNTNGYFLKNLGWGQIDQLGQKLNQSHLSYFGPCKTCYILVKESYNYLPRRVKRQSMWKTDSQKQDNRLKKSHCVRFLLQLNNLVMLLGLWLHFTILQYTTCAIYKGVVTINGATGAFHQSPDTSVGTPLPGSQQFYLGKWTKVCLHAVSLRLARAYIPPTTLYLTWTFFFFFSLFCPL